jgi:hypothetical protein
MGLYRSCNGGGSLRRRPIVNAPFLPWSKCRLALTLFGPASRRSPLADRKTQTCGGKEAAKHVIENVTT